MIFKEPLDGWFTHLAWNIDLRRSGPFVRASRLRHEYRDGLAHFAHETAGQPGITTAHALEVTVIPPIKGAPEYDIALIVHSKEPLQTELVSRIRNFGFPEPELALTARNGGLIGDTEERGGEIL